MYGHPSWDSPWRLRTDQPDLFFMTMLVVGNLMIAVVVVTSPQHVGGERQANGEAKRMPGVVQ